MLDIKEKRHITVVGRGGASNIEWDDIQNKPEFATVATSGDYDDLNDKPNLATVATSGDYDDLNDKPNLATVATSGSYDDLTNKPTILTQWFGTQAEYNLIDPKDPNTIYNIEGGGQVQANWTENDSSDPSFIQNKPTLATVATSGSYNDLSNTPNLATVATSGSYNDLSNTPSLATVATSGDYTDLNNTPSLATVATSGSYNDLTNKPAVKEDLDLSTLTQAQYVDFYTNYNTYKANYSLNWGGLPIVSINSWQPDTSISPVPLIVVQYGIYGQSALMTGGDDEVYFGVQLIGADGSVTPYSSSMIFKQICHTASYNDLVDKPNLATVATSGSYNDLSNKPSLATVATSGSYNDLSNKPTIPTVPNMATETLTFTIQGGTTKTIDFYTVPDYFYVENRTDSNGTFTIKKSAEGAPSIQVYSSTDRINWTNMGTTSTSDMTISLPANGKTYLKATANNWGDAQLNYNKINTNYNCNVGGNIMSLLYGDSFVNKTTFPTNNTNVFSRLFANNTRIISAENLILPATTLKNYCYSNMFEGCTRMTTAPATLPATTLAISCYLGMFSGCRALTTAPVLPATTLAQSCYQNMFYQCTALTTAPVLPATTLVNYCYQEMFNSCSSLNNITIYANNISASNCLKAWVNGVAAQGDFFKLGTASFPSGVNGIPSGWTTHTSL